MTAADQGGGGAGGELRFCSDVGRLVHGARHFDAWALDWTDGPAAADGAPTLSPEQAVAALHRAGPVRGVPVGVIGPKEATAAQMTLAEALGARIADMGLQLLCGGKNGVMEAVCRGNAGAGGRPIGMVPDEEWTAANPHVAIPLATGIGPARNVLIARACFALVAVGGGYGTLSEMAFGLHFDRLVLALDTAPEVPGAIRCSGLDEVADRLSRRFLKLDGGVA